MADPTNTPAVEPTKGPSMQPLVGLDADEGFSMDMPLDGSAPGAGQVTGVAATAEIVPADGAPVVATPEAPVVEDEVVDDTTAPPEGTSAPEAALAAWDPANPEVVSAYEGRYFTQEGKLNLEAVTKEFWSNAKEGKAGTLHADTYKYLEETLGVTEAAAKSIEAGLVAQQAVDNSRFWQRVGGKARYSQALEWGKATYQQADKDRFNKAIGGADTGARDDAIDALLARFDRANPGARPQSTRRGPPRRQAAPARSVTTQAEGAATSATAQVPYADAAAYTKAFQTSINAVQDAKTPAERRVAEAARERVRQDGRASQKHWK